jgi:hypothetical protein
VHQFGFITQTHLRNINNKYRNILNIFLDGWTDHFGILTENQQMHQNDPLIVMSSQTLLHVCHHQAAHMILTSYLYVGVQYTVGRVPQPPLFFVKSTPTNKSLVRII